ncbi:MAG: alpha/beta hydrolase [Chloroflexota bacterium]
MPNWHLKHSHTFQGQRVRYDIRGNGPPLVLVHGTPWSSFNWRHLIAHFAEQWTVYFYDLLGYGQSEMRTGQDVSLGIQNQILASLLDHWQLTTPCIIGHDFGGTTVLRTHLIERRNFAKIVLVDPVALSPWGSPFFAHVKKHEAAFQDLPEYIHEAVVTAYVKGAMYRPMPEETLAGIIEPWRGETGRKAFYRQIAQADQRFTDDITPQYATITHPVLLVWGEKDTWIPIDKGQELHTMIPGSQFRAIPNAGHLVQEDEPEKLFKAIQSFLK